MQRTIAGFHADAEGDWVAQLDCGHDQHVRHQPPFHPRPWVTSDASRAERLGTPLECPLCDRCELPARVRYVRRSASWDSESLPRALRRSHRLARGTWGQLVLEEGRLAFRARTTPPIDRILGPGTVQPIPPVLEHEVEPQGDVRLFVEFLEVVAQVDVAGS